MHSASREVEEFGELPEGCPSHSHSGKLPSELAKACFNDETGTYYPSAELQGEINNTNGHNNSALIEDR